MILCAVQEALNDPQAAEVVTWASDPLLTAALVASVDFTRGTSPQSVSAQRRRCVAAVTPASPDAGQRCSVSASEGHTQFWA